VVSRAGLAGGGAPNKDSYHRSFFMTVGMSVKPHASRRCEADGKISLSKKTIAYLSICAMLPL
jgi:hypothetical protein